MAPGFLAYDSRLTQTFKSKGNIANCGMADDKEAKSKNGQNVTFRQDRPQRNSDDAKSGELERSH